MNALDKKLIVPTISIVGWSGSGKTTFVVKLIENLVKKGYKIASFKHNAYKFQMDKKGKDSYRHKKAGASMSIISSKEKVAIVKDLEKEENVEDIINNYVDNTYDLVIVEGFKSGFLPKFEIYRPSLKKGYISNKVNLIERIVNDSTEEEFIKNVEYISEKIIKYFCLKVSVKRTTP